MHLIRGIAAVVMASGLQGLLAAPPAQPEPSAPTDELIMPARLRAEMAIVNADVDSRTTGGREAVGDLLGMSRPMGRNSTTPLVRFPTTSATVTMTIRRFSLEEEKDTLRAAIESGGVPAVLKAMKRLPTLGEVSVGGERLPIRAAVTWMTEHTQSIRLVFSSRLVTTNPDPFAQTTRALDILDLSLPRGERYGTGSLVTATKVEFEMPGVFSPVTLAGDGATQPLSQVERLPPER
jgi:hypothetical protein